MRKMASFSDSRDPHEPHTLLNLAIDRVGNVLVADKNTRTIHCFASTGALITQFESFGAEELTIDLLGRMFVCGTEPNLQCFAFTR